MEEDVKLTLAAYELGLSIREERVKNALKDRGRAKHSLAARGESERQQPLASGCRHVVPAG